MEVFYWNCDLLRIIGDCKIGWVQSVGNYPYTCNLIRFLQLKNFFLV
jgi:hypothetical protein